MLNAANTTALVLAQAAASFSPSQLRWEFANTAAAVALLSAALAAITLFCFRRGTRDLTLIYFGLFCTPGNVRLTATLPSFRSAFDASRMFWVYIIWVIWCTITLRIRLFLRRAVGEHSAYFLRWPDGALTVSA